MITLDTICPVRRFVATVSVNHIGNRHAASLSVRCDDTKRAIVMLGTMAELKYGTDYRINGYYEDVDGAMNAVRMSALLG